MTGALAAGDLQLRRFDAGVDGHRGWSLSKWDSSDGDAQLSHCGIGASKAPASPTTSSIPARTPVIGKRERFTPKPCFSSLVLATERAQTELVQATRRVLPQTYSPSPPRSQRPACHQAMRPGQDPGPHSDPGPARTFRTPRSGSPGSLKPGTRDTRSGGIPDTPTFSSTP